MLSIIVALDDKRGIGRAENAANKGMLWHISEDFKRFKALTTGHPIIMGRKTHEMIARLLPNRTNIIITRDPDYKVEGAVVVDSLQKALEQAHNKPGSEEVFIIGGGQIFTQALPLVDKVYVTLVKGDFGADVFFPEYEKQFPRITFEEKKSEGEYTYTFQNRERLE